MKVLLAGGQSRSMPTHVTWGLWVEFSLSTAPRPVSQALLETVARLGRGERGGCCTPREPGPDSMGDLSAQSSSALCRGSSLPHPIPLHRHNHPSLFTNNLLAGWGLGWEGQLSESCLGPSGARHVWRATEKEKGKEKTSAGNPEPGPMYSFVPCPLSPTHMRPDGCAGGGATLHLEQGPLDLMSVCMIHLFSSWRDMWIPSGPPSP